MKQGPVYALTDGATRWIWEFGRRGERHVYVDEDEDGTIIDAGSVLGTHATESDIRAARKATLDAIEDAEWNTGE